MKYYSFLKRHGLFDAHVPRYTSYPPANRFRALQDKAPGWMASVPAGEAVSFYLHIPFCRRLCWFCACRTQGTKTDSPVENYVRHLETELDLAAAHLPAVRAGRVHFGGGTPTLMQPDMVARLMARFDAAFPRSDGAELSVEIDPTEVDRPRLAAFVDVGMNRASLGVQDFDDRVQAAIGRPQGFDQTKTCLDDLRAFGVKNVNLDILYGLPFQTSDTLARTLDRVISLDPDRIAAFGYAHVPWMSKRQTLIPEAALPDPYLRLELFEQLAESLDRAGYVRIGIDHFAKLDDSLARACKDGTLHRNFQGYTDDQSPWLIGLGASAISRYPQGYLHNATSTADYLNQIDHQHFATRRGIEMTTAQKLIANMIEQLMCYGRIGLEALSAAPASDLKNCAAKLTRLAQDFAPLAEFSGGVFRVQREAWPLLRIIAARLDECEPRGQAHAIAV